MNVKLDEGWLKRYSFLKKGVKSFLKVFVLVLIAFSIAIFLRLFVIASFKIPTPSMEPTILSGDYVFVNKLIFGPRLFKPFCKIDRGKFEVFRLPGLRKIKRNDVLVFNFPYRNFGKLEMDINVFYIKRCVAIPGDIFYIENGFFKVQGCMEIIGNYANQLTLSRINPKKFPVDIFNCFPFDENIHWNVKNFGPIYIPKKNDKLTLNHTNICIYKKLIEYETLKNITIEGYSVFLDGHKLNSYLFKNNYYFMAGDNVFNSRDSRYWGLLPEDHIIGKATIIWKSVDLNSGKKRLKRFFNIID